MNKLKSILTFLIVIMAISISNAQFGVRAGANFASLKIKVDFLGTTFSEETDKKLGGHIGAYYKKQLNEKLTIRPNLIFTTGGGQVEDETTGETNNISVSYLGVPVDFLISVPVGENSLSLMGGPFIGFLLSSSSSEGSSDEDDFSSIDYGLNIGLQFQAKSLGIGFSYGNGMANIIPTEDVTSSFFGEAKANTRVISLFVTYDIQSGSDDM